MSTVKSRWPVGLDTSTPCWLRSLPCLSLPTSLTVLLGITSQVSQQQPGLVWGSALGRSQAKTASSAMSPSSSPGHATASGEHSIEQWWKAEASSGSAISTWVTRERRGPARDPWVPESGSARIRGPVPSAVSGGWENGRVELSCGKLVLPGNELLLSSIPLLLDKAFFYSVLCFWDSERGGVWSSSWSTTFIALSCSWYQRSSGNPKAKAEESILSSFPVQNWHFFCLSACNIWSWLETLEWAGECSIFISSWRF